MNGELGLKFKLQFQTAPATRWRVISLPLRIVVSLVALAFPCSAQIDSARASAKWNILTSQYVDQRIAGWVVRVNRELLSDRSEVGGKALLLLETKLKEVVLLLPPHALSHLQSVPIWLGVDDYEKPNAVYHPSADWLRTNGFNPDKAKAVEIPNAAIFLEWSDTQPMMVLHELAHAFHHQVIGHGQIDLRTTYERARSSGLYEKIPFVDGRLRKAYALNNDQEFFAEMSEAYFGKNDFFPFTRDDLKSHDPETCALIEKLWSHGKEP